ncbi:RhoGAP domain protein [Dictyocaulus viviparus]|uniref:RhoGAP domain protein n=1 Tax=Dictyocaulus viviparus TaxID=29172 RepID=A0A0D8Y3D1_DICVI|nr:RhoGAP domain protein [Dictyocaulus viviparus]
MSLKLPLCASLTLDQQLIHIQEIRVQLNEQIRCIGERTETQIAVLQEVDDFFRKRGEAEAEYSRQLEKIARGIMQRHKAERSRRDSWTQHATCSAWQHLVDDTRAEAQQRQVLAELYSKQITASISSRCEDLNKISKRCREIGSLSHSEINRVLTELHTAMKTYQLCYSEMTGVERKLRIAEEEKRRYEEANPGKTEGTRKYRSLCKYLKKREDKYDIIHSKCTKGRNEYLMCIRAANAALHRFFAQDLSYLIDCMDLGMDYWTKSLLGQVVEMRKRLSQRDMDSLAELGTLKSAIDAKADKQRFFEAHHATFMLPKQFEFRPQLGDCVSTVSAEKGIGAELAQRQKQIEKRLEGLRFESDEVWKSLEASDRQLLQLYNNDFKDKEEQGKWRQDILVTYQYYLKKFEYFLLNGNLIERLEARSRAIGEALSEAAGVSENKVVQSSEERTRRRPKRIGVAGAHEAKPRPKLFGGSLEEYTEMTGEAIPLVVVSAISYLSRYSLRNQGLFRVSGSQSEINRFKEAYERGDDAFAELTDGSESNSVAGVLKLYLRELREPLFPIFLFDQFTDCAKAEYSQDFVRKAKELIEKLPLSHILLLRFLFSFLSHLCEFADENMMEPHNMAICFGPTLMPIPEGKDQVFYHNFVNELVRNLILHVNEVFPHDLPGPAYDKYAAIAEDGDHMGFMDDILFASILFSDGLSEDEDCLRNGVGGGISADSALAESTYDMSNSTEIAHDQTVSTLQQTLTPEESSQPASVSSRSSNRSNLDAYLRRMSEDVSPVLRSDMPHLIANEVAAKFAAKERDAMARPTIKHTAIWEQERPLSHMSHTSTCPSYSSYASAQSSSMGPLQSTTTTTMTTGVLGSNGPIGIRPPTMTSLRDQLHHFRKELYNAREDTSKVYPIKRVEVCEEQNTIIAPTSTAKSDHFISIVNVEQHSRRLSTASTYCSSEGLPCVVRRAGQNDGAVFDVRGGSEAPSSDQPDVVASTRDSIHAQGELQKMRARGNASPPLDELAAEALKASRFD